MHGRLCALTLLADRPINQYVMVTCSGRWLHCHTQAVHDVDGMCPSSTLETMRKSSTLMYQLKHFWSGMQRRLSSPHGSFHHKR